MQKKNLLKAICVALVTISFSCAESTTEKTITTDSLTTKSAVPIPAVEDTTKKDSGDDRTTPRIPPAPETQTPVTTTTN